MMTQYASTDYQWVVEDGEAHGIGPGGLWLVPVIEGSSAQDELVRRGWVVYPARCLTSTGIWVMMRKFAIESAIEK